MRTEHKIKIPASLLENDEIAKDIYKEIESIGTERLFGECGEWIAETKVPNLYLISHSSLADYKIEDVCALVATTPEADEMAKKVVKKLSIDICKILSNCDNDKCTLLQGRDLFDYLSELKDSLRDS